MKNRCHKCDCDRFQSDKKGNLTFVHTDKDGVDVSSPVEDGMSFVMCAWCSNRVLFVDPTQKKESSAPAELPH